MDSKVGDRGWRSRSARLFAGIPGACVVGHRDRIQNRRWSNSKTISWGTSPLGTRQGLPENNIGKRARTENPVERRLLPLTELRHFYLVFRCMLRRWRRLLTVMPLWCHVFDFSSAVGVKSLSPVRGAPYVALHMIVSIRFFVIFPY